MILVIRTKYGILRLRLRMTASPKRELARIAPDQFSFGVFAESTAV
jgi:hypothetical protein